MSTEDLLCMCSLQNMLPSPRKLLETQTSQVRVYRILMVMVLPSFMELSGWLDCKGHGFLEDTIVMLLQVVPCHHRQVMTQAGGASAKLHLSKLPSRGSMKKVTTHRDVLCD